MSLTALSTKAEVHYRNALTWKMFMKSGNGSQYRPTNDSFRFHLKYGEYFYVFCMYSAIYIHSKGGTIKRTLYIVIMFVCYINNKLFCKYSSFNSMVILC